MTRFTRSHTNPFMVLPVVALILLVLSIWVWEPLKSQAANGPVVLEPKTADQQQAHKLALQAQNLMRANKPFRARPLLEEAVRLWKESPYLHFTMAVCYTEIGEFAKAIPEYETAVRMNPKLTDCFNNIASCYQLMGQPEQAITWFESYLRRDPNGPESGRVRGMIIALRKQMAHQVVANPNANDYLESIMPGGRVERWQRYRLPIKIYISNGTDEQGYPVAGFREYFNDMIVDAFDKWMEAGNNKLSYTIVDDASIADIVCSWTNRRDFLAEQGSSAEQGVARVASRAIRNQNQNEIVQVRVIILLIDPEGKLLSDQMVKKTCLHEIGHALGFAGHSNNNRDVMFYSESPTVWAALTKRDKATMARLYSDYPQRSAEPSSTVYSGTP